MDTKTRVKKIKEKLFPAMSEEAERWLLIQFNEAVREAVDHAIDLIVLAAGTDPISKKLYQQGFAAAQEKAAGIADLWTNSKSCNADGTPCDHRREGAEIAERIRAMEPDK